MSEAISELLPRFLVAGGRLYLHPDIPASKLAKAKKVHEGHLRAGERVLALYDDTLFGGGADGFLLTDRRICWKNLLEDPRQIEYTVLEPGEVDSDGSTLIVAAATISTTWNEGLADQVAELLRLVSAREIEVADDGEGLTERFLLRLARDCLGLREGIYYHPSIPQRYQ